MTRAQSPDARAVVDETMTGWHISVRCGTIRICHAEFFPGSQGSSEIAQLDQWPNASWRRWPSLLLVAGYGKAVAAVQDTVLSILEGAGRDMRWRTASLTNCLWGRYQLVSTSIICVGLQDV